MSRPASLASRLGYAAVAVVLLATARAMHVLLPTPALLRRLRATPARTAGRADPRSVSAQRWAIAAAARRVPWRADCMVQALAGKLWLDALGIPSELRLGARREGDALAAHAWLLAGGEPVTGGRLDEGIAPFAEPASRA